MLTVSAPKKVREKLTRDYQRKLEEENVELLRRLIAVEGYMSQALREVENGELSDAELTLEHGLEYLQKSQPVSCGHGEDSISEDGDCLVCALKRCADYGEEIRARLAARDEMAD